MGITVTGENLDDIRARIGNVKERADISINWRRGMDYGRDDETGCIVRDSRAAVGKEFADARSAISYIAGILNEHDSYAKEKIAKRKKELAAFAKKK